MTDGRGTDGRGLIPLANGARRCGVAVGGAVGAFVAAAALATGSAAPAKADLDAIIDPIIQPLLTSVTDSLTTVDPTLALDLTSWADNLFPGLDLVDVSSATSAASDAVAASSTSDAVAAASTPTTYDLPITVEEGTEPTVGATVDGSSTTLLVDTGSSGLVIPDTDLGAKNVLQLLLDDGLPSKIGESGYSGGVDYIYLTYDETVDYTTSSGTLDTEDIPVEVVVRSWDPGDFGSFFTNDAFKDFLDDNDVTGILGIGDSVSGGAGESPIEAAGYTGVTVDLPQDELIVSDSNAGTAIDTLKASGSTVKDLTETVTTRSGQSVGSATVDDDLDSGGVYGTIPSSISSSTLANGDVVKVYDGSTLLYEYTVSNNGVDGAPTVTSGDDIDSGVQAFQDNPVYIDYSNDTISIDDALTK